jgi:hypothetical protein
MLAGYKMFKNHPNKGIRKRIGRETRWIKNLGAGLIWLTEKYYKEKGNNVVAGKMAQILKDLYNEFGLKTRIMAPILGRIFLITTKLEEKRLAKGFSYEPNLIREQNPQAIALEKNSLLKKWRMKKAQQLCVTPLNSEDKSLDSIPNLLPNDCWS